MSETAQKAVHRKESFATVRNNRSESVRRTLPPVTAAQQPNRSSCACGGTCPRCTAAPTFSALIRSATEESATPLHSGLKHKIQSHFSQTLPELKLHTGPAAQQAAAALGTRAFTIGRDLVFNQTAPPLETGQGFKLLIHEVAHALQSTTEIIGDPRLGLDRGLEAQAQQAADYAAQGLAAPPIDSSSAADHQVQREDPTSDRPTQPFTSQGHFQYQLDPEIQRELFRMRFRLWMLNGQQGSPLSPTPSTLPASPNQSPASADESEGPARPAAESSPADRDPAISPAPGPGDHPAPLIPPPGTVPGGPLSPRWLAPDILSPAPDIGALIAPFHARGAGAATSGDLEVATQLYYDRYRFVSLLPDLREFVPGFARTWVPRDWRRRLAQTLTSMTIDNAIKGNHPTFIEASDQFILQITGDQGSVPTYIFAPAIEF